MSNLNPKNSTITFDHNSITKSGRFFRKTKIDELPQIFNVIIGNLAYSILVINRIEDTINNIMIIYSLIV